jgi:pyruvate kinase
MDAPSIDPSFEPLISTILELRSRCLSLEQQFEAAIERITPEYRDSARNLLHYLCLRQHDLRDLQTQLSSRGLSSLGRSEAHVMAALNALVGVLGTLAGRDLDGHAPEPVNFVTGPQTLNRHTDFCLGPAPPDRSVRIMVTMPSEAATDYDLVLRLVQAGMNVMRINCAHDDATAWRGMAENLRRAARETGVETRVLMDLPGPKLRTGPLPAIAPVLMLRRGDKLRVTADPNAGGHEPPVVPCSLPEVLKDVRVGERVFFDDGKIASVVVAVCSEGIDVEITQTQKEEAKLRPDKGINLPDTQLTLPAVTSEDLEHLDVAVEIADMVGYSFVRRPEDIQQLEDAMTERNAQHLGLILKIENQTAFENLPRLLLTGLQSPPLGVMVARGDLGVELGFERLAEVQEEILWISEAAHVPVIWATQVLESLAKKGMPSRAEVTDAAMGVRAECVMLNKGPHIVEAVRFLDNVLRRMQDHQAKKRAMLRKLNVSALS